LVWDYFSGQKNDSERSSTKDENAAAITESIQGEPIKQTSLETWQKVARGTAAIGAVAGGTYGGYSMLYGEDKNNKNDEKEQENSTLAGIMNHPCTIPAAIGTAAIAGIYGLYKWYYSTVPNKDDPLTTPTLSNRSASGTPVSRSTKLTTLDPPRTKPPASCVVCTRNRENGTLRECGTINRKNNPHQPHWCRKCESDHFWWPNGEYNILKCTKACALCAQKPDGSFLECNDRYRSDNGKHLMHYCSRCRRHHDAGVGWDSNGRCTLRKNAASQKASFNSITNSPFSR